MWEENYITADYTLFIRGLIRLIVFSISSDDIVGFLDVSINVVDH